MVLKIQGNEYILKYDVNALVMLEDLTGKSLAQVLEADLGFKIIRDLLQAGLRKNHKINGEHSGELIQQFLDQGQTLQELSVILMKAFEESNLVKKK